MEFRFSPKYGDYQDLDARGWNGLLRKTLAPVHLACEAVRLGRPDLTWNEYPGLAFRHVLLEDGLSPRAAAKRLWFALRSGPSVESLDTVSRLGLRAAGPANHLAVVFPIIAYHMEEPQLLELAREILHAERAELTTLRRAYLRAWGAHGDVNFATMLKKHRLSLWPEP